MKKNIILMFLFVLPFFINAQEQDEKKFGITFSGFVKTDVFYDSRQNVAVREGHFLLWPQAELLDSDGKDINAKENFNILSIQTRLTGSITGPDAFGAETSGLIEGAFFGNIEGDVNGFRLRHAFVKLNWTGTELMIGQYWHPMFVTGCFPGTVSFNTGAPFQPFSRNPQIRLTQKLGDISIIAAVQSQRDFANRLTGAADQSSSYLRNAMMPDLQIQVHYGIKNNEAKSEFLIGAGAGYKQILPGLNTVTQDISPVTGNDTSYKYVNKEMVKGISAIAFCKVKLKDVTFKAEGAYGENVADYLSLGGFAVKDTIDASREIVSYTPLKVISVWTDIHTNNEKMQLGIFAGYSKNLGAKDDITGGLFGLGQNIAYIYRISPRIIVNSGKVSLAGEIEYTTAAFGKNNDVTAVPENAKEVTNIRFLFAAYYFF